MNKVIRFLLNLVLKFIFLLGYKQGKSRHHDFMTKLNLSKDFSITDPEIYKNWSDIKMLFRILKTFWNYKIFPLFLDS